MKKRKYVVIVLVLMLVIGFAAVTSTLVIRGVLNIGENSDDFNIIFTSAKLDGRKRNDFISEDKKHIEFISNELKSIDDEMDLVYEVTNTSRNFDADVHIECESESNEYIMFQYTPSQMIVESSETKSGILKASMLKAVTEETDISITCTLVAEAKERESLGEEYIEPFSKSGVMMEATNYISTSYGMWEYRDNITRVIFENKLIPHETSEELIFDISEKKDKSVMAYLTLSEELLTDTSNLTNTNAYNLYIQGETGIKANPNSSYLFRYFKNLLEIENLKYFDTSNVSNMAHMFSDCSNLIKLDLSSFDTSNVTELYFMFDNCFKLTYLNVDNFDIRNVESMWSMFSNCESLISLDLNSFHTESLTSISSMFRNCKSLKYLNLSNFNTSKITDMLAMFEGCSSLQSLDLSSFDTSNVTTMASMFYNCESLTSIDLSSFDTSKVTNMVNMFLNCKSLTNIDLGNFDTSNVIGMRSMFLNCESLTTLDLSAFNTSKVTIMGEMFEGCVNLISLDLRNFDTTNVTDMSYMFCNCKSLTLLDVSNFVTSEVTTMTAIFKNCSSLIELDLNSFDFSKVNYKYVVFTGVSELLIVKVKDSIAQDWILALSRNDRPISWTTENVIIKEA